MEPILNVNNISYSYKDSDPIINNVSLEIRKGELFTILGPNGAGKSTLLNCVAGLFKPTRGEVLLEGENIEKINPRIKAKKIAYVPQNSLQNYGYSVRDYIVMGRAPHIGLFLMPSNDDYKIVDAAIEMLGINHFAYKSYLNISGGERQLANIARAIVQQPEVIIFDEPTSALDYGNQIKMMKIIKQLSKKGYSIILTTHNPDHAILLDGTVGILDTQGCLTTGPVKEIMDEDILSKIYRTKIKLIYLEELHRFVCVSDSLL